MLDDAESEKAASEHLRKASVNNTHNCAMRKTSQLSCVVMDASHDQRAAQRAARNTPSGWIMSVELVWLSPVDHATTVSARN